jgi:TolB-like protein/tetratricopeptide (TPR) repeat protein
MKIDNGTGGSRETSTGKPARVDERGRESINFFAELKRRNVYKVAVAYAVVGWLLVQVATQVFPFFEIPNWAVRLVVLAIVIGFPIALAIAWAFELTPQGLKRTEDIDALLATNVGVAAQSPRKPHAWIYIVIVGAALSVSLFFVGRYTVRNTASAARTDAATGSSIPQKSIAVLPFENLSDEKSNTYFVDGTQDEILTRLAKISALKVISRTSTMRYASHPGNLAQIARDLGVANILEGSVQRAGDTVRVNVQLIKAETDSHLWAETYDRDVKNIFSVESEIAQNVADALRAKLLPEESVRVASVPTKNPEAYDLFLKAEYFANQIYLASAKSPEETGRQAADLYEKASAKDPAFALAYVRLAYLKARLYWYNFDPSPQAIEIAHNAVARALTLQPELPEAHMVKGYVHYWGHRDYDAALAEFAKAREALPNNTNVLTGIAFVHRRQAKMSEAKRELEQAATLDPRDNQLPRAIGETLVYMRRYAEADTPFNRALVLFPEDLEVQVYQVTAPLMRGDLEAAQRASAAIPASSDPQGWVSFVRCQLALAMHQPDAALATLEHAPAWLLNSWPSSRQPVTLLRGQALALKGETGRAREAFLQAQQALEPLLKEPREQADAESFLALAYAGLGQKSKALEAGRHAVAMLPASQDLIVGGFYLAQLAMVEAQVGETQSALNHIEELLAVPAGHVVSTASLRLDPAWNPLRNDPGFEKLITREEAKIVEKKP